MSTEKRSRSTDRPPSDVTGGHPYRVDLADLRSAFSDEVDAMVAAVEGGCVTADEARILIAFDELTAARHEDDEAAEDAAAKRLADVLADVSGELARLRVIVDLACECQLVSEGYCDAVSEYADVVAAGKAFNAAVATEVARRG